MPVAVVFRCEICGRRPGRETQVALELQLLDHRHGEYVDAEPERWLSWHGRGIYGPNRYACGQHRGELKAFLREGPTAPERCDAPRARGSSASR